MPEARVLGACMYLTIAKAMSSKESSLVPCIGADCEHACKNQAGEFVGCPLTRIQSTLFYGMNGTRAGKPAGTPRPDPVSGGF